MSREISRRGLVAAALSSPMFAADNSENRRTQPRGSITDVPGVEVGHWTSDKRPTGCTVILTRAGAVAGVDVRGGAPGTRDTALLRPEMTVEQVHGVALSGGSAFGLDTASGVTRYLEGEGIGISFGGATIPIVPAAILFDLRMGGSRPRPDAEAGFLAAQAASGGPVAQGNVGAGAGATVGKLLGEGRFMKGGLGSASLRFENGLVIGAIAAVNAVGDVCDPRTGEILAGARTQDGAGLADAMAEMRAGRFFDGGRAGENTTIGAVAANVSWTKAMATKVAQMAHDGLAMAVRPAHMPSDGDTVFALGTGGIEVDGQMLGWIGALAAELMAQAIVSAVLHAEGLDGFPAHRDLTAP